MFVDCPCCQARIEVDRESGKVARHWTKRERPKGDPLKHAVAKLKADEERLGSYFANAAKELAAKKKQALEKFEAERQRILREGDTSRPPGPFDLD